MFITKLVSYSIASVITLYLGHMVAGSHLVFGNIVNSPMSAIIISGVLIGIIVSLVEPILADFKTKLAYRETLILYYIVNSVAVYLLARTPISVNVGMGISGFWVALFVGLALYIVQYAAWLAIDGKKKK